MPKKAANNSGGKGNPAHKRIGNTRRKDRRAACWARGEARKKARNEAQKAAAARNRASGTCAWDVAREARRIARRAA